MDITLSLFGLFVFSPLMFIIMLVLYLFQGSVFFNQERLGLNGKPFLIIKFRTMFEGTISVATHLSKCTDVTPIGHILRRTKLDEMPQLWNVLKGEMSLVGPRPGLPSQGTLTEARALQDVYSVRPGITGLAQIKGIDMSTPELLAQTDAQMVAKMSLMNYFRLIFLTVIGNGRGDRIKPR